MQEFCCICQPESRYMESLVHDHKQGGYLWDMAACAGDRSSLFTAHMFHENFRNQWSNVHMVDFGFSAGDPSLSHYYKLRDVRDPVITGSNQVGLIKRLLQL